MTGTGAVGWSTRASTADAAGAGDVAEAADVEGLLGGEDGGAGESVVHDGVGEGELGDFGDVRGDGGEPVGVGEGLQGDAAGADGAAQQPVAGDFGVEPQQLSRGCAGRGRWRCRKPTSLARAPRSATWL